MPFNRPSGETLPCRACDLRCERNADHRLVRLANKEGLERQLVSAD